MKILFVSNYASWNAVRKDLLASHHLFGIYQEITSWNNLEDGNIRGYLKDNLGYVDFYLCRSFRDPLKVWLKSYQYDIVYDTMNSCRRTGSLIYYLSPAKLVQILHHPPFYKQLRYGNANAYIFFSDELRREALKSVPYRSERMFVNYWQPDKNYIAYRKGIICKKKQKYTVIDNGKTNRDHELLVSALQYSHTSAYVLNRDLHRIDGVLYVPNSYISDSEVIDIIMQSRAIVIPMKRRQLMYGPIGATSFMDAIALGKPVICSNYFYLADLVRQKNIGLVYKAGNVEDLAKCLSIIESDERTFLELENNVIQFAKKYSIDNYSATIFSIFRKILHEDANEIETQKESNPY